MHVAHYNVARLRELPGHPLVAEFVDNAPRVNAVAARSPGFVWRFDDASVSSAPDVADDPYLAYSLSVWESADALIGFVQKTVHASFLRRRAEWFVPWTGPNYVVWPIPAGHLPGVAEAEARLKLLAENGATPEAYDFKYLSAGR